MRKHHIFVAAGAALLTIAGCQTKPLSEMSYAESKQYVAQLIDRCQKEGVTSRQEMELCVHQEARADEAKRVNAIATRRAIGRALQAAAASQPRTTTCNRFGNTVNCTTF
ncbi:MAG: hypothetical protein EOR81_22825 [Mesorhizobium sp.]|nr:MAG: hypothetical protein EOR81_22825 [Mesorhizobium sp.]